MKFNLSFILLFSIFSLFGQTPIKLEIPTLGVNDTIINHIGYSVSYNHKYRQANWVAYQLTKLETTKLFERADKFKYDPLIKGTDNANDYEKSGYDRGHLAPAADMSFSEITMLESFYYSNMPRKYLVLIVGFGRNWKSKLGIGRLNMILYILLLVLCFLIV